MFNFSSFDTTKLSQKLFKNGFIESMTNAMMDLSGMI